MQLICYILIVSYSYEKALDIKLQNVLNITYILQTNFYFWICPSFIFTNCINTLCSLINCTVIPQKDLKIIYYIYYIMRFFSVLTCDLNF